MKVGSYNLKMPSFPLVILKLRVTDVHHYRVPGNIVSYQILTIALIQFLREQGFCVSQIKKPNALAMSSILQQQQQQHSNTENKKLSSF